MQKVIKRGSRRFRITLTARGNGCVHYAIHEKGWTKEWVGSGVTGPDTVEDVIEEVIGKLLKTESACDAVLAKL